MKDETKKVIALFPNLQEGITVGVDVKSDGGIALKFAGTVYYVGDHSNLNQIFIMTLRRT